MNEGKTNTEDQPTEVVVFRTINNMVIVALVNYESDLGDKDDLYVTLQSPMMFGQMQDPNSGKVGWGFQSLSMVPGVTKPLTEFRLMRDHIFMDDLADETLAHEYRRSISPIELPPASGIITAAR